MDLISYIRLKRIDPKSIKTFNFKGLKTYAKVSNVYDGDTIHLTFSFRFRIIRQRCRFARIDSPEIKGKTQAEKDDAIVSRDFLRQLIENKIIYVHFKEMDKYGRPIIEVYNRKYWKHNINDQMIESGMAVLYDGGTKIDRYTTPDSHNEGDPFDHRKDDM